MANSESEAIRAAKHAVAVTEAFRTVRALIWAVVTGLLGWFCIGAPAIAFAGQETHIGLEALVDLKLHFVLPWAAAGFFFVLWSRERRLRKDTVRRENQRNRNLELKLDPDRTSSGFEE